MGELNDVVTNTLKSDAPIYSIEDLRDIVMLCEQEFHATAFMKAKIPNMRITMNVSGVGKLMEKTEQIIAKRIEIEQRRQANEAKK